MVSCIHRLQASNHYIHKIIPTEAEAATHDTAPAATDAF